HVELSSEPGRGSCFCLRVPLRLSILPALMAGVAGHALAIPLSSVRDVFPFDADAVQRIASQPNLVRGGSRTPLVSLRQRFALPAADDAALVVMLERGARRGGIVVDRVHGREEIVVKPLGAALAGKVPFSGAAVLGDGRIALVLDPEPLLMAQAA
ncbi:MAG TPA: chemotaxis protein CheW, partial [Burkholderiaceae bacterium]